jgi:TolB-like protein
MKIRARLATTAVLLAASLLGACAEAERPAATPVGFAGFAPAAVPLVANYEAADALVRQLGAAPNLQQPILVATLVDVNRLERSSGFGRIAAEQIGSRIANSGLPVAEVKLRNAVLVEEGKGELMLSRNVRDLARMRNAQAVVVGTYAVGRDSVFVNVRLVGAGDGRVISAHDYVVPMTGDVVALLNSDLEQLFATPGAAAIIY